MLSEEQRERLFELSEELADMEFSEEVEESFDALKQLFSKLLKELVGEPPKIVCDVCESESPGRQLYLPSWCDECEENTYSKAIFD